jgi:hypothetical protein
MYKLPWHSLMIQVEMSDQLVCQCDGVAHPSVNAGDDMRFWSRCQSDTPRAAGSVPTTR